MRETMENKIEELLELLENDSRIQELKKVKEKLLSNDIFLEHMRKLQSLDIYSDKYKELKLELFKNKDFVEYKHLENDINILILAINQKLKKLVSERGCNNESN